MNSERIECLEMLDDGFSCVFLMERKLGVGVEPFIWWPVSGLEGSCEENTHIVLHKKQGLAGELLRLHLSKA